MQFPSIEDEDNDFSLNSAARSRLSSLFQSERASGDVNQALTFTAPKQPKKNDNSQSNQGTLQLIHAATVHAYKLIDGNYSNQGKLGCAILGLHESSSYKLLLYKGKQVQVATTNILPTFKFHVRPNNYASFYDEKNENWSINFDSESALLNFTKQIALSKFNCQDKNKATLIIQDLALGDGASVDIGDSAEVKYTGWILTKYTFGQVFDTNMQTESSFRLRLGKKVIKGWSDGLVGAQKGSRRLLIIPSSLAYGSEGMGSSVPPNSTLIFEILVTKIRISRDSSHSPSPLKTVENVPEKKPEVLPRHSLTSEDNIRLRGASISEQLSQSPKKDKAQLISRMAKMGTATLPFQGAIPAHPSSESEDEEAVEPEKPFPPIQSTGSRTSSPKPASVSSSRKNSEHSISSHPLQLQSVQESNPLQLSQQQLNPLQFYPQTLMPNQQAYGLTTPLSNFQSPIAAQYQVPQIPYTSQCMPGMMPHVPSMTDTHLSMLATETRSQNTEVRLSLSKITEKVDTVIQKIDDIRVNQEKPANLSHSAFVNSSMLVQSIEKIVQENSQLKEDVEAKSAKIQTLNEKVYDLLQRNQRFFEESNYILEQRSDSIQAASTESQIKLLNLEKEKAKLSVELSDALQKSGSLEVEIVNYQNQESELRQKFVAKEKQIEQLELELSSFKKNLEAESENSSMINSLKSQINQLSSDNTQLNNEIKALEDKYKTLNENYATKTEELQNLKEQLIKNLDEKQSHDSKNDGIVEMLKKDIENVQTERENLNSKCESLQKELSEQIKASTLLKEKIHLLQTELKNALSWKEKYEIFYQKTRQMKESYEAERQKLIAELKNSTSSSANNSPDFSGEIKKVMNILYKMLQGKFESNSSYTGNQVLETTLQAIRALTFQMLQKKDLRPNTLAKEPLSDNDSATKVEGALLENDIADSVNKSEANSSSLCSQSLPIQYSKENTSEVHVNLPHFSQEDSNMIEDNKIQNNSVDQKCIVTSTSSAPESSAGAQAIPDHVASESNNSLAKAVEPLQENGIGDNDSKPDSISSIPDNQPSQQQEKSYEDDTSKNTEPEENKEESSKDKEVKSIEESKVNEVKNQSRDSPEHMQQSSTNLSGHSFSETDSSKVLDMPFDVHA